MQVPTEQCSLAAIMRRINFKRGVGVRRESLRFAAVCPENNA